MSFFDKIEDVTIVDTFETSCMISIVTLTVMLSHVDVKACKTVRERV